MNRCPGRNQIFLPLVLNPMAQEKKWVLQSQSRHFLPGGERRYVLDWFWANMEKGYYLWAPGSHKRFSWVKPPWQYGFLHSVHKIAESVGKRQSGVRWRRGGKSTGWIYRIFRLPMRSITCWWKGFSTTGRNLWT